MYGRLVEGLDSAESAYDNLAPDYDTAYLSPKDIAENRWLAGYLRRKGIDRGSVLDVGCGTGLLHDLIRVSPSQYLGIDISQKMLAVASAKYLDYAFTRGSMMEIGVEPSMRGFQHVIYLFGVFSYALDPEKALSRLADSLAPGGDFLIMLLSHRYPDRASYSVSKAGFRVPMITWDSKEVARLFQGQSQLKDITVRGMSYYVDRLPRLPVRTVEAYYRSEMALLSRRFPDKAAYLIVEGRRQ